MTTEALAIPQQWSQQIQQFETQRFNILAPRVIGDLPPFHTPRLEIVQINPDVNGGEIYPLPANKFGLSKVALDRISQAAGISWLPEQSGRVDDGSDPNAIRYKAVGKVKDLSGIWRVIMGEKEIDLIAVQDELEQTVPEREWIKKLPEDRRPAAIAATVEKEMIQFRKHRLARAQSGAMGRAIRQALALRSQYTLDELKRPFVVPKVVFTPDASDRDVKLYLLAEATGSINELFGGALRPGLPALPGPADEPDPSALAPAVAAAAGGQGNGGRDGGGNGAGPATAAGTTISEDEKDSASFSEAYNAEEAATKDGKAADANQAVKLQNDILRRMMLRKGYPETFDQKANRGLRKPLEEFTREQRLKLFNYLDDLPDAAPAIDAPAFS